MGFSYSASVTVSLYCMHLSSVLLHRWQHTVITTTASLESGSKLCYRCTDSSSCGLFHTCIRGLFGTHWYHHHPGLQGKHYPHSPSSIASLIGSSSHKPAIPAPSCGHYPHSWPVAPLPVPSRCMSQPVPHPPLQFDTALHAFILRVVSKTLS